MNVDNLITELLLLKKEHGNKEVGISLLSTDNYYIESKITGVSFEYSDKIMLFGVDNGGE